CFNLVSTRCYGTPSALPTPTSDPFFNLKVSRMKPNSGKTMTARNICSFVLILVVCLTGTEFSLGICPQSLDNPTFRGFVVDENQQPLAGVDVWIPAQPLNSDGAGFLHCLTDANGKFKFELSEDWKRELGVNGTVILNEDYLAVAWFHHEGKVLVDRFSPDRHINGELPFDVKLTAVMPEGMFRVVNASGEALDGAIVTPVFIRPEAVMPSALADRLMGMSEPDGVIAFPMATFHSVGILKVESRSNGTQFVPVRNPELASEVEIQLSPVGSLEGIVVDADGKPVPGVMVQIETSSQPAAARGMVEAISGPDGTFQVFNLAAGQVFVRPMPGDENNFWFRKIDDIFVNAERPAKMRIVCETERIRLEGLVTDIVTGDPLVDVRLKISFGSPQTVRYIASGPDGNFETDVPESVVLVEFVDYPDGYVYAGDQASIGFRTSFDEPVRELDIRLTPERSVSGTLLDQDGQPATGAAIYAVAGDRKYGRTVTGRDGSFTIKVPRGTAIDRFEAWAGQTIEKRVEIEGEDPLVLRLGDLE
ncbi:MAG: carboxypeptidase-like regulatory domain-containing protein, partial [Planctomycetota bacterium]